MPHGAPDFYNIAETHFKLDCKVLILLVALVIRPLHFRAWLANLPAPERRTAMPRGKRAGAELLGTFWLVFGGCGSAALTAAFQMLV